MAGAVGLEPTTSGATTRCTCLWRFTPLNVYRFARPVTFWAVELAKPYVSALKATPAEQPNHF